MRMRARHLVTVSLAGLGGAAAVLSATLDRVDLTETDGRYQLVADSWLDATPDAISAVLLNFEDDAYTQISEIYKESDALGNDADGTPLVYTLVEGCVMLFCRKMSRVERLEVVTPTFIRSTVIPERSDFRYSTAEWTLTPEGEGTRVHYRMALEPNFWLPPMIGPTLLRRILMRGGVDAVERIEELAQEQERAASL
jgi:hypothetical protein